MDIWRLPRGSNILQLAAGYLTDNHDRDRFLCLADDNYQKLRLALTFLFTVRGIPDVYYGTEQECYGGGVPTEWAGIANKENREMMPGFSQDGNIYRYIQRLTELRKDYACLRSGTQREDRKSVV